MANDTKRQGKRPGRKTTSATPSRRHTAVYFHSVEEMQSVRDAARRAGKPFTVFIREAALRAAA